MNPSRPSVKSLFDAALEIESPQERDAFLARIAADDVDLHKKVESLLLAYFDAGSFLDAPAVARTIDMPPVAEAVKTGKFSASAEFRKVSEVDAVLICVPTPLNKNREPDISYIIETGKAMARHLQKGTLVVLESTTYPGTTDEDLREVLEVGSGLEAGRDFHLAFSPEREDPGNPDSKVATIPKVVGGYTPKCLARATELSRLAKRASSPGVRSRR
jgi:UDP-N-acetyl-D-mannosaminuronate dehydrogenase